MQRLLGARRPSIVKKKTDEQKHIQKNLVVGMPRECPGRCGGESPGGQI